MADAIVMPDLGSGMEEGTLLNWTKQIGDTINEGDTIAEIETDKATVEVPSPISGKISQLIGEPGGALKVGAVIGYVGEGAPAGNESGNGASNGAAQNAAPAGTQAPAAAAPTPAQQGQVTPQSTEGSDAVPYQGGEGDAVPEGGSGAAQNGSAPAPAMSNGAGVGTAQPVADEDPNLPGGVRATPVARRIAEERGIDLRMVRGSGPNGRVVKEDVENFNPAAAQAQPQTGGQAGQVRPTTATPTQRADAPAPSGAHGQGVSPTTTPPTAPPAGAQVTDTAPQAAPAPNYGKIPEASADVEIIETSKMRARIAARMIQSKQQIPHFYVTMDIDVEPLLALRKQINEGLDEESKVSVNDLIVKAAALTVRQYPNLNTHYYGDKLARHKRINIGIAVALPAGGLINVVSKDADKTSLSEMARNHKAMIARAREGKIKPDDTQGETFTVSNLGPYDVDQFAAIISPPETGILAVSTAKKIPIVLPDGTLGVGTRMKVTLSADHRTTDGAEGAQFMQAFKNMVEHPMRLLV